MAPRKNVLRLVLVAGLAVLLSGCYARYPAHYGASYAYGSGGGHYATPGHGDHGSGRHANRRHGYRYRGW